MSDLQWTEAELAKPPTLREACRCYYRYTVIFRSEVGRYLCRSEFRSLSVARKRAREYCGTVFRVTLRKQP